MAADFRYAARTLRASPGFTLTAIATIALGVGASTAIFSVVNKVLLEPLPYPEPDQLVQLMVTSGLGDQTIVSIPQYLLWRDLTRVFRFVTAYDIGGAGMNLMTAEGAQPLAVARVSAEYFEVFGAKPLLGRTFSRDEDRSNGKRAVVLSPALWRKRFGGDTTIVGRRLWLDQAWYTVVGVLGPGFSTDQPVDIWLPLRADAAATDHVSRVRVVARVQPGVKIESARQAVAATLFAFEQRYPAIPLLFRTAFTAIPLRDAVVGSVRTPLFLLIGAVGFVLLISCANMANLLLARSSRRARDLALRAVLGAERKRLVWELLTESALLAALGGMAGLALGYFGVRALLSVSPGDIPRIANGAAIGLDWRVFLFTMAVSLVTGLLFGLWPALTASQTDFNSLMKDNGAQSGMSFRAHRARPVLVIAEVALALVLLAGAGLMIRTFVAMRTVNRGFDEQNVLTMQMSLASPEFEKTKEVAQLVRATVRRVHSISGVSAVAATSALPLEPSLILQFTILKNDHTMIGSSDGVAEWQAVSPEYFDAFHIRLMRGRVFNDTDEQGAPGVVIINRMMMRKYWNAIDANPIGEYITIGRRMGASVEEAPRQIIGVVTDVRDSGFGREPMMYVPLAQMTDAMSARNNRLLPITWVVRASGAMPVASVAIQHELRAVSGGLPLERERSMHQVVAASSSHAQFYMLLLSIFAGIALALAAVGLYGVMAYSVQQRTQEIGIRMALGAAPEDVRGMVLWQGMRLVLLGIAIGVPSALALARLMVGLIFGITPWDPSVFAAVTVSLSAVTFYATLVPSVRATSVDPALVLRA
jgi:predicted permease